MVNLPKHGMFHSREDLLADVYRRQEERIAYDPRQTEAAPVKSAAG